MPKPVFNTERCKGCGLCTSVCVRNLIFLSEQFNSKGYQPACCKDDTQCIGCLICARTCPDVVIEIHK